MLQTRRRSIKTRKGLHCCAQSFSSCLPFLFRRFIRALCLSQVSVWNHTMGLSLWHLFKVSAVFRLLCHESRRESWLSSSSLSHHKYPFFFSPNLAFWEWILFWFSIVVDFLRNMVWMICSMHTLPIIPWRFKSSAYCTLYNISRYVVEGEALMRESCHVQSIDMDFLCLTGPRDHCQHYRHNIWNIDRWIEGSSSNVGPQKWMGSAVNYCITLNSTLFCLLWKLRLWSYLVGWS